MYVAKCYCPSYFYNYSLHKLCYIKNWADLPAVSMKWGWTGSILMHQTFPFFWKWLLNFIFEAWSLSCLPSIPSSGLSTAHFTRSVPPWCHAAYSFTLSSLCWLLARCLFLFLLSVFSCTVPHWGRPLHPLPVPVCSPPAHSCHAFSVNAASLLFLLILILSPGLITT